MEKINELGRSVLIYKSELLGSYNSVVMGALSDKITGILTDAVKKNPDKAGDIEYVLAKTTDKNINEEELERIVSGISVFCRTKEELEEEYNYVVTELNNAFKFNTCFRHKFTADINNEKIVFRLLLELDRSYFDNNFYFGDDTDYMKKGNFANTFSALRLPKVAECIMARFYENKIESYMSFERTACGFTLDEKEIDYVYGIGILFNISIDDVEREIGCSNPEESGLISDVTEYVRLTEKIWKELMFPIAC